MAEFHPNDEPALKFSQSNTEPTSWLPWAVAGVVIALGLGLVIALGGHRRSVPLGAGPGLAPVDAYAASLAISDIKMSEASNFAGGKVTYLDGKIANHGDRTLTAITVQVAFRNELKEIAQKETLPLSLIRTREPYVDTQAVSAAPLKPGDEREFRLIFDSLAADWNQQYPEVRVIQVAGPPQKSNLPEITKVQIDNTCQVEIAQSGRQKFPAEAVSAQASPLIGKRGEPLSCC